MPTTHDPFGYSLANAIDTSLGRPIDCDCNSCREYNRRQAGNVQNAPRALTCTRCGIASDNLERLSADRDRPYCPNCISSCNCGCGTRAIRGSLYNANGQTRCLDSIWECRACYTTHTRAYRAPAPRYCETCARTIRQCAECQGDFRFTNESDTLCDACCEDRNRAIHSHSYRPPPQFFKLANEKNPVLYMGVELEVDRIRDRQRRVTMSHDEIIRAYVSRPEFYCKHDGSIDDGFEIVSHPASYAWWMNEPLSHFPLLAQHGYKSYNTSTCGMHVHVSRNYFTTGEIFKLLEFMDVNPRFILKMSRREPEHLRQWARPGGETSENLNRSRNGNDHDDRYRALNLENEKTVEFRIFRGTLNIDSFKLNLAFVRTLCGYIKDCSMRPTYPSHYCDWLKKHRGVIGNGKLATRLIQWVSGACLVDEVAEV